MHWITLIGGKISDNDFSVYKRNQNNYISNHHCQDHRQATSLSSCSSSSYHPPHRSTLKPYIIIMILLYINKYNS